MFESSWEVRAVGDMRLTAAACTTVSLVVHGAGLVAFAAGLLTVPPVKNPNVTKHYAVRHIDLQAPQPRQRKPEPAPQQQAGIPAPPTARASVLPLGGGKAKQTLVQPGFRTHDRVPFDAPVPSAIIWMPELAATDKIVPPMPAPPTSVKAPPSVEAPNQELQAFSDPVTSGRLTPLIEMQQPATTTPMVSQADSPQQLAPSTMSRSTDPPTPAAVLSISDLRMQEGSVILPPVNQLHGPNAAQIPGSENAAAMQAPADAPPAPKPASGEEDRNALASRLNAVRVQLPKDGRFGFVAVGSIDGEEYPEAFEMWNGRVAYTAYLHVGLAKNWIMQYAQTSATDAENGGVVARLEAPWPYDILRPNLSSGDLTADVVIIHGMISDNGHFESLALAFPAHFPDAERVLAALKAWQFRPARQQGKAVPVEVLLIIPDQAS